MQRVPWGEGVGGFLGSCSQSKQPFSDFSKDVKNKYWVSRPHAACSKLWFADTVHLGFLDFCFSFLKQSFSAQPELPWYFGLAGWLHLLDPSLASMEQAYTAMPGGPKLIPSLLFFFFALLIYLTILMWITRFLQLFLDILMYVFQCLFVWGLTTFIYIYICFVQNQYVLKYIFNFSQ